MGVLTRLTAGGRVTLPKAVRDELHLRPFDKLEIRVVDGEARLRKADLTLADLEGIFPALDRDIDPDEAIRIAKEERAARWRESHDE
jgi:AbrB family looped-hinge helix DNA binding protein